MTVLVPPDEWVGIVDLRTGLVTKYLPLPSCPKTWFLQDSSLVSRRVLSRRVLSRRVVSRRAMFHTHPPHSYPIQKKGKDRPSSTDIHTILRLDYPVHMVVTNDGVYVINKYLPTMEALPYSYEFFRRLKDWETRPFTTPQQVVYGFHDYFSLWGLQCYFYPVPKRLQKTVVDAVQDAMASIVN